MGWAALRRRAESWGPTHPCPGPRGFLEVLLRPPREGVLAWNTGPTAPRPERYLLAGPRGPHLQPQRRLRHWGLDQGGGRTRVGQAVVQREGSPKGLPGPKARPHRRRGR